VNKEKLLLEQWKVASELHRHMDNMAWQRFNYFTAANGVLLAALGAIAVSKASNGSSTPCLLKVITIAIPILGTFISLMWYFIQKRGQGYHHYRTLQAKRTEEALLIDDEWVLDLYEKSLNQYIDILDDEDTSFPPKLKRYYKSKPGQWRTHSLIGAVACFLAVGWFVVLVISVYALFL